jgi:hypothetical protein
VTTGKTLLIRPISNEDKQLLREGFERLSERSRYQRLLSPQERSLVAIDRDTNQGVGVARYVRSKTDPTIAESEAPQRRLRPGLPEVDLREPPAVALAPAARRVIGKHDAQRLRHSGSTARTT